MPLQSVQSHRSRVQHYIVQVGTLDPISELVSVQAHHLCVLASGYLERSVVEILNHYVKNRANLQVQRYLQAVTARLTNLKSGKLLDLLGSFDESWKNRAQLFLQSDGRGEAINSLVANRHLIAHGRSASISFSMVRSWLSRVDEVVDFVYQLTERESLVSSVGPDPDVTPPRTGDQVKRGRSRRGGSGRRTRSSRSS